MVTFVTAFLDLHESRPIDRTDNVRVDFFKKLEATGVRLHVFVSPEHRDKITVRNGVIETLSLEDLDMYSMSPNGIPNSRCVEHDTRNFLILMNAKIELVNRAIDSGKHTSSHYAWIDFNVYHVLTDPNASIQLKAISTMYLPPTCMYMPGCWGKGVSWDTVNWRFCGGFFLGDVRSLRDFYELYCREYPNLPKLTWEVNTWAYLESIGWNPTWYAADHNDSIIRIPEHVIHSPPDIKWTWNGYPHVICTIGGPMYRYVLDCIRSHALTAMFPLTDGIVSDDEYDLMMKQLGREEPILMPAREFHTLTEKRVQGTEALVCVLATRSFSNKSVLILPNSDDVFEHGLKMTSLDWNDKKPMIVWRGGSSGLYRPSNRMLVVERLCNNPVANVRFVNGGLPVNDSIIPAHHFGGPLSPEEQSTYKYILNLDGNSIASSIQWTFASGSVPVIITHPGSSWWFHSELKPMLNYVPIAYDLSDLDEKIEWLIANDEAARLIAENARALADRIFTPEFQRNYISNCIRQMSSQDH